MPHSVTSLLESARENKSRMSPTAPAGLPPDFLEQVKALEPDFILGGLRKRLSHSTQRRLRQHSPYKRFAFSIGGSTYSAEPDDRSEIIWSIADELRLAGASPEETAALVLHTCFWRERAKEGKRESIQRLIQKVYSQSPMPASSCEALVSFSEDPGDWAHSPLPVRQWLLPDVIPMRKTTGVYGDGGTGKTTLMLQLMMCIALGMPFLGITVRQGRAFALLAEDEREDTHIGLHAVCAHHGVSLDQLKGRLRVAPRAGFDNALMAFNEGKGTHTKLFDELMADIKRNGPFVLIVLDTAADLFGGNENDRAQVRQFVAECCTRIALETNAAVVLCAHPSVAGMKSGDGYAGSTAWNASMRSRLYLRKDMDEKGQVLDPDLRILELRKSNFSAAGQRLEIRWIEGAYALDDGIAKRKVIRDLEAKVIEKVSEAWDRGRPFSAHHQGGPQWAVNMMVGELKFRRPNAKRVLEGLLSSGKLVEATFDPHRHKEGLCTPEQAKTHAREATAKQRNNGS